MQLVNPTDIQQGILLNRGVWTLGLVESSEPTSLSCSSLAVSRCCFYHTNLYQKSEKTKEKPGSRNINQEQNSDTRSAFPYASHIGSHPKAAGPVWGSVWRDLGSKYFRDRKIGDGEIKQFPSNSSISWPRAILPLLQTHTDSEEQGLSMKSKLSHSVEGHTSQMFLPKWSLSFWLKSPFTHQELWNLQFTTRI